jgi:hypothetical protein
MNPKISTLIQRFIFFMMLLSGFAQMPIFKRYYIADIPGLGWLADYGVTHVIHYGFAIVFTLTVFYRWTLYALENRVTKNITGKWLAQALCVVLVLGVIISGFFLVARNLPGYRFSADVITGLDVVHLVLVMMFLILSLGMMIYRRFKQSIA